MSSILSRFEITGLHDRLSYDVRLNDDKLVIVSENGTGKTTLITIMYLFLTGQWAKLSRYKFQEITATIGDERICVSTQQISAYADAKGEVRHYSVHTRLRVERMLRHVDISKVIHEPRQMRELAQEYGFPMSALRDYLGHQGDLFDVEATDDSAFGLARKHRRQVLAGIGGRVLFLPTYRRIEQDLKALFPDVDPEKLLEMRRARRPRPAEEEQFLELVEFGMEDVSSDLQRTLDGIKDHVRTRLYNLAVSYLAEVVEGSHRTVDVNAISKVNPSVVRSIIDHIDERILSKEQKIKLSSVIQQIQQDGSIKEDQKVLAHFFLKLLGLQNEQESLEASIRQFVAMANSYLTGKKLVYDPNDFTFNIALMDSSGAATSERIRLPDLSSGEKQIVSLFSKLHLSQNRYSYLLIDEPELSLSVEWQKKFLADIIASKRCNGVIAVTHSPFIFDNSLDRYARSLADFIKK